MSVPTVSLCAYLFSSLLTANARDGMIPDLAGVTPLPQAHAHNDYLHDRPLVNALSHGFGGIEADVFLVSGDLWIAHDKDELEPSRTLRKLYLDPLAALAAQSPGGVYPDGTGITLLVDIKTEAQPTYQVLHNMLEADYKNLVTVYKDGEPEPGPVTVIVSGNRPRDFMKQQPVRYAGYDGRLSDLGTGVSAAFMPLISDHWGRSGFRWNGEGEMPAAEREKLIEYVKVVHAERKRLRFWATADTEKVWGELFDAGADLINTDDLDGLAAFLRAAWDHTRTLPPYVRNKNASADALRVWITVIALLGLVILLTLLYRRAKE